MIEVKYDDFPAETGWTLRESFGMCPRLRTSPRERTHCFPPHVLTRFKTLLTALFPLRWYSAYGMITTLQFAIRILETTCRTLDHVRHPIKNTRSRECI
jgi:hypothetical protein